MSTIYQCKPIARAELIEALKPFPEYVVSDLQLNVILPNKCIVSGVDDVITVYTKACDKQGRGRSPYKQTDIPPEGTEVFPDKKTFLKALITHIKDERFNHFNLSVPEKVKNTLLAFSLAIREGLISDFRESANCADISSLMGRDAYSYTSLHDGGYMITDLYLHSLQDSTFHFTKTQTEWGSKEVNKMVESFKVHYDIPEEVDIDYDSPEFEEWESDWENDFHCQLTVKVTVPSDSTDEVEVVIIITYGYEIDEVLVEKLIPLSELANTDDLTMYSMEDHVRLLKIEIEEYEEPIVYFNMASDGEVAIPEEEYSSIKACLESVNYSLGCGFYPFQFIKRGNTIVHPPQALGKTVEQVSEFFKLIHEPNHEEDIEEDSAYYLHQLSLIK